MSDQRGLMSYEGLSVLELQSLCKAKGLPPRLRTSIEEPLDLGITQAGVDDNAESEGHEEARSRRSGAAREGRRIRCRR